MTPFELHEDQPDQPLTPKEQQAWDEGFWTGVRAITTALITIGFIIIILQKIHG